MFKLKQKINEIVKADCWTFDDVFKTHRRDFKGGEYGNNVLSTKCHEKKI